VAWLWKALAQARPPAHYIAEIDVTNEISTTKTGPPKLRRPRKPLGGTYLVRSTDIERIEGTARMSVRKRTWTTRRGERREAWIVDYVDQDGDRHIETFEREKDA
jgi:hypothetical protein